MSLISKIIGFTIKKVNYSLLKIILLFKKFDIEQAILIFSEARGGSTWLMEIFAQIPQTIINWEPLHPKRGVVPHEYKWGDRPSIPKGNLNKEYVGFMQNILTLKVHSQWTLKYCSIVSLLNAKTIITKFVRANLLLPWTIKNINLGHKPILLVRHPIDTCISQIKAFGVHPRYEETNQLPDTINNQQFAKHLPFLKKQQSDLEYQIAIWCINNVAVLNDKQTLNSCILVFYEDLIINPATEVKRIMYELNSDNYSDDIISDINFHKASSTDFRNSLETNPKKQLKKNLEEMNAETKDKIQQMFDYFRFNLYTAHSPYPIKHI